MAAQTDQKGVLQTIYLKASKADLCGTIQEVIGNRHHAKDGATWRAFLLSFFKMGGDDYCVVGSDQYRSIESIRREMTPFASHDLSESNTNIELATSGFGGNLLPIRLNGGAFSMMSSNKVDAPHQTFSDKREDWCLLDSMYISKMNAEIQSNDKNFMPKDYEPRIYPSIHKDHNYIPFFSNEEFRASPLFNHITETGYRHFYICKNPSIVWNPELNSANEFKSRLIHRLEEIFEVQLQDKSLALYYSYGLESQVSQAVPGKKILLHPANSMFTYVLEWMLGERQVTETGREWWKNNFRVHNMRTGEYFYGTIEANGKDVVKDGRNRWNLKTVKLCDPPVEWVPDLRISIARLRDDAMKHMTDSEKSSYGNGVYLRIQGDVLNDTPSYKGEENIRNLADGFRYRIVVDILSKKAKNAQESGIDVEAYKKLTTMNDKKSTALCVKRTVSIIQRTLDKATVAERKDAEYYTSEAFYKLLQNSMDDRERAKDTKKSREGVKFELSVGDYLKEKMPILARSGGRVAANFEYETNDAHISAKYELKGQAIDILARTCLSEEKHYNILIQVKDKKQITQVDKDKFFSVVDEMKAKFPNDIFLPIYVQKQVKTYTIAMTNDFTSRGVFLVSGDSENDEEACESIYNFISSLVKNYNSNIGV
jgi:hypothetical protein